MSSRLKLATYRAAHDVGNCAVLRLRDALKLIQHVGREPEREQPVVLHVGHCITIEEGGAYRHRKTGEIVYVGSRPPQFVYGTAWDRLASEDHDG